MSPGCCCSFPLPLPFATWPRFGNLDISAGLRIGHPAGRMDGAGHRELAEHGPAKGVGGLLNATFGNAAELIIAGIALSKGLTTVVKASLTGSILGNLLLVSGAAMLAGSLRARSR